MTPAMVVLRKELRELLRDRRTLIMMIVVPVLLYPALMIASEQLALFGLRSLEADASSVGLLGSPPPDLLEQLGDQDEIELVEVDDAESAIRAGIAGVVGMIGDRDEGETGNRRVTVLYDAANERSQRARAVLLRALDDWEETLLDERLESVGLPSTFVQPIAVADSSIARPEEVGGYALGRFLPMLLIVITLLGAFYPAIDLAAGEKERGTLETLMTAPVPPGQIVAGKFLTVTIVGLTAAALNLGSMLLTFQTGLLRFGGALEIEFSLPVAAIALIFATLVPLAVLFGSLFLGIALRSRSFKEAQNALTPIYLFVLVPALLPLFPGIDFTVALALVPVAGVALLFRELMSGGFPWTEGALALGSTVLWAGLALRFAADSFGRETVLFGVGESGGEEGASGGKGLRDRWARVRSSSPDGVPSPAATVGFALTVAALFFYLGVTLQVAFGEPGILYSEWLLLFVPAVLFVVVARLDWRRTFSVRLPRSRDWVAAVLIIAGGFPMAWLVAWLQGFILPIPFELLERMSDFLVTADARRVAWLLLLIAVTPAICEEAVFRGIVMAGTRDRLSPVKVILLNAAVFGAFHLSFETAFRFLPTAWLGLLLATVVWKTGSIWPGVVMHFLNNGTVVILAASPTLQERLADWEAAPPMVLLAPAAILVATGMWILFSQSAPAAGELRKAAAVLPSA